MKQETRQGIAVILVGYLCIALGIVIASLFDFLWGIPLVVGGYLVVVMGVMVASLP